MQDIAANNEIDALVFAQLQKLRLQPAELAADHVFLRRAYLDAIGLLPTRGGDAGASSRMPIPEKREKLIDALLARPEFADYWAQKWSDLLRNEEKALDRKGVAVFYRWIAAQLAADRPLNEFARDILSARGSTYANPPANFWRAVRDPLQRAEAVAQVFLGIRVGCARCHNHPFDRWTSDDYYGFADLFARVDYRVLANDPQGRPRQARVRRRADRLPEPRRRGEEPADEARRPSRASSARDAPTFGADADRLDGAGGLGGRRRTTRSSPGRRSTASGCT